MQVNFRTGLKLDEHGYLDPIVYDCDINFGETHVNHKNPIEAMVLRQFVNFGIIILENSTRFVGEYVYSGMLGPVMDSLLNDYRVQFVFPSPLIGQTTSDVFEADFRNVRDPKINADYIDFAMTGNFRYNNTGCALKPDFLEFIEPKSKASAKIADRRAYSQIVVSESVATCWANQIAKSNIG